MALFRNCYFHRNEWNIALGEIKQKVHLIILHVMTSVDFYFLFYFLLAVPSSDISVSIVKL